MFLLDDSDRWSQQQAGDDGFLWLRFESARLRIADDYPAGLLVDTRCETGLADLIADARERSVPVISLHDLGLMPLASDIAIDGSILPFALHATGYPIRRYGGTAYLVLDPAYAAFRRRSRRFPPVVRKIVINAGGGDARRHYCRILGGLRSTNLGLDVVGIPGFASWGQEKLAQADWSPLKFRWADPEENMAGLMFHADCAITAGGLAAYEALCVGTPLCAFSYDRFQKRTVDAVARAGACLDLGCGARLNPPFVTSQFLRLAADRELRRRFSQQGREIVDGGGARRVAGILRRILIRSEGKGARRRGR